MKTPAKTNRQGGGFFLPNRLFRAIIIRMEEISRREIKPIEQLVFSDDFMFGAVMREPEICKGVLERLLKIKIDHIEYPELQKSITPFYSRKGVRLDVYVSEGNRVFDVECQSYKAESIGKRSRYYQAMLDIDSLMKGADYSELKESFVIFICLDDPFKAGLPVYTFERICAENKSVELGDRTHHLIFNSSAYDSESDPELRDFLLFMKSNKAQSNFTRRIESMVQTKKFEQSFVNEYMAWNLHDQDMLKKGRMEGRLEGRMEAQTETARKLLEANIPVEIISETTSLPVEFIEKL